MTTATTLRPIDDGDRDFLFELYASTRADEMALLDWDSGQKQSFLEMQFHAQHTYYQEQFRQAAFDVVMSGGERIGRLYIDRRPDEIRVIDIALLPAYRGRGIGSGLMAGILDEARQAGLPVRIHVERFNPAMHLYNRIGFRPVMDQGVYILMEWTPSSAGVPGPVQDMTDHAAERTDR